MPLILAIEPDRRQAAHLTAVVKRRVHAELILVATTAQALDAIGNRVPDLVLVPALLSPQDDAALAAALRVIAAAARVQMLTIPVLGAARPAAKGSGMLSALRRGRPSPSAQPDGCDPGVFADQIASYLERAAEEKAAAAELAADDLEAETEAAAAGSFEAAVSELAEAAVSDFAEPAVSEPAVAGFIEPATSELAAAGHEPGETAIAELAAAVAPEPIEALAEIPIEALADIASGPDAAVVDPPLPMDFGDPLAPGVDESVAAALDEAVLALFSNALPSDPVAEAAEPLSSAAAEPSVRPFEEVAGEVAGEEVEDVERVEHVEDVATTGLAVVSADGEPVAEDDWPAVDELMAALEALPLAAVDATDGEWTPPAVKPPAPAVEGPQVVVEEPEEEDVDLTADLKPPAARPEAAAAAAKSEPEWVALIASLRHDVERLRTERADKPAARQQAESTAAPARTARAAAPGPAGRSPRSVKAGRKTKPVQDEWGFFDPEQCGFAALLAKLEEVTDSEDGSRV